MNAPTDLIPAARAARILGCHLATVHRWVLSGRLPGWRRLGRWLVSEADARALLVPVDAEAPPRPRTAAVGRRGYEEAVAALRRLGVEV